MDGFDNLTSFFIADLDADGAGSGFELADVSHRVKTPIMV